MLVKIILSYSIFFLEGFTLSWLFLRNPISESISWGIMFPAYPALAVIQFLFNDSGDARMAWFIPLALIVYGVTIYLVIRYPK